MNLRAQTKDGPTDTVAAEHSGTASAPILSAGSLQLDCGRRCAVINNKDIPLAPNELNLLHSLLETRGRAVSRETLLDKISVPGRGRLPKVQSVDVHIKRLRQKLGDSGRSIITVRNVGYRFEICAEWFDRDSVG